MVFMHIKPKGLIVGKANMNRSILLVAAVFLLAACAPAAATPPAESQTPTEVRQTATEEPATEQPTPQAGPGEVVVIGARNSSYTIYETSVDQANGAYQITLEIESSPFSGSVIISIPDEIGAGSHQIVNLFKEEGIVAMFVDAGDSVTSDVNIYKSIGGSLEITQSTGTYAGSFTFSAAEFEWTQPIIVSGGFEGATAELAAREIATAAEETATETATKTPVPLGTGEVVVRGNHKLKYTLGYTSVDSSGYVTTIYLGQSVDTGVALMIPQFIEPGTYDIGNLVTNEGSFFARFDFVKENGKVLHYASTEGELVLKETGSVFSGSFEFKAILHMGEGMEDEANHVTVTGKFKGVVVVIEERG